MFYRRHSDKLIIPIIIIVVLIASSYRAKYHLQTQMPAGFFNENNSRNPTDEKIAWAYWETALMEVQWKYGYSHPLPADPPPEFQIDGRALGPAASDPATRTLY